MNGRGHTAIAMYHGLYCDLEITIPYIQEYDTSEIRKMILSEDDACRRLIRGSEDYEFGTITNYEWEEKFSDFTVKSALIDWIKMKTDLCLFIDDEDEEDKKQDDVEYSFFVTYYDVDCLTINDSVHFDKLNSCKRYIRNSDAYRSSSDNIEKNIYNKDLSRKKWEI